MKLLPKIALAGPKGGGKTWLINEVSLKLEFKLQELKLMKDIKPISTIAFADPIYEAQLDLFDYLSRSNMKARMFNEMLKSSNADERIHPVIGMSPRGFRQQYGTEFARARNPNIWVDIVKDKVMSAEASGASGIILLDLRFPNELTYCKEHDFWTVYVNTVGAVEGGSHVSESHCGTLKAESDYIVSSKAEANMAVDEIVTRLISHLNENKTDAGLIVPKGKLN